MESQSGTPVEVPLTGRQEARAEGFKNFCRYFGEEPSDEIARLAIRLIDDHRVAEGEIPPVDLASGTSTETE